VTPARAGGAEHCFPADYDLRQERIDVSGLTGFRLYPATRPGVLTFTHYERWVHGG